MSKKTFANDKRTSKRKNHATLIMAQILGKFSHIVRLAQCGNAFCIFKLWLLLLHTVCCCRCCCWSRIDSNACFECNVHTPIPKHTRTVAAHSCHNSKTQQMFMYMRVYVFIHKCICISKAYVCTYVIVNMSIARSSVHFTCNGQAIQASANKKRAKKLQK